MIKGILLLTILVALVAFNWDKVPQPVKTLLQGVKTVSGEVYEKGKDMPSPVKEYVDSAFTPKAEKLKSMID